MFRLKFLRFYQHIEEIGEHHDGYYKKTRHHKIGVLDVFEIIDGFEKEGKAKQPRGEIDDCKHA